MELPKILRFDPVPVRARHDGWSADDQRRFILKLSRGHLVDEACRNLGHSRHDNRNALPLLAECDQLEEEWKLSKLTR